MTGLTGTQRSGSADFARLQPGFADPVHDAQSCFRTVLDAMAHPGSVTLLQGSLAGLPPAPLGPAAISIALTLCDIDTLIWLDKASAAAAGYLAFHCGAPFANTPDQARFAFIADAAALPPLDTFALGSDEYPERSATLVIEVSGLVNNSGILLHGPGIRDETRLGVAGLPTRFWAERQALAELFPRGLDVLFVCDNKLAALSRSTRIEI
jgi:alpha-D-ribose 1-methylphosphonate 5-triphosphate synthase subunit PhnH